MLDRLFDSHVMTPQGESGLDAPDRDEGGPSR
jgi:hypothetical protein